MDVAIDIRRFKALKTLNGGHADCTAADQPWRPNGTEAHSLSLWASEERINAWLATFVAAWAPHPLRRAVEASSPDADAVLALTMFTAPRAPNGMGAVLAALTGALQADRHGAKRWLRALAHGSWHRRAHAVVAAAAVERCEVQSLLKCDDPPASPRSCATEASTLVGDAVTTSPTPSPSFTTRAATPLQANSVTLATPGSPPRRSTAGRAGRLELLRPAASAPLPSRHPRPRRLLSSGFLLIAAAALMPCLWSAWTPPAHVHQSALARWCRLRRRLAGSQTVGNREEDGSGGRVIDGAA
jgi:hypothetical protein